MQVCSVVIPPRQPNPVTVEVVAPVTEEQVKVVSPFKAPTLTLDGFVDCDGRTWRL